MPPKWSLATGKEAFGRLFGDMGSTLEGIPPDSGSFNLIMTRRTCAPARAPAPASTATGRAGGADPISIM